MRYTDIYKTIEEIALAEATEAQRQQYQSQLKSFQMKVKQAKQTYQRAKQQYDAAVKQMNDFKIRNAQVAVDTESPEKP